MIEGGDSLSWYHATKKEGYSDSQIRDGFIWWIEQPNTNPGKKSGASAQEAGAIGIYLFRNDPLIESAILEAQKNPQWYEAAPNFGHVVAINGSNKLIDDFRKIGFDVPSFNEIVSQKNQNDRDVRRPPPASSKGNGVSRLPKETEEAGSDKSIRNIYSTSSSLIAWLLVGMASLLIGVGIICSKKLSRGWVFILILIAGLMLVFAVFVMLTHKKSVATSENAPEERHESTEAVFSSNVVRTPYVEIPHLHPAPDLEEAQEDDYLKLVEDLMKPFSAIDSMDRQKADAAKAGAARELLDLLDKGRPIYLREDKWRSLIDSVVARQTQSEENMAHCLEVVKRWIDQKDRNPGEAVAALTAMTMWSPGGAYPDRKKDFERVGKIAELQMSLLPLVPKEDVGTLLGCLTAARETFHPGKETVIQTVVSAEKAAVLIRESMARFPGDSGLHSSLISVVANRVKADPSSLNALGPLLHEMLGNDEVGDLQKLGGYRAISSFQELPPWIKDNSIATFLETARLRQPEVAGTFFANSLAMEISEARVPLTEGEDRLRYVNILLKIAEDQEGAEIPIRLRAVRALVNSKVITAKEAAAKFGGDSGFGLEIKEAYLLN